jgi:hypothetical protein
MKLDLTDNNMNYLNSNFIREHYINVVHTSIL